MNCHRIQDENNHNGKKYGLGKHTIIMLVCCMIPIFLLIGLPLLGFSAVTVFLVQYQIPFILLGIFSNLIGITMMLGIIQKKFLYEKGSIFGMIFKSDMTKIRNILMILSTIILVISFIWITL